MLHFGPTALHQRAAGFKCASWGEGEAKVLMASALCSQLSVPPKLSFHSCCPTAGLTGWACQVFGSVAHTPQPPTLEGSKVTGAESLTLHSAVVPGGQVLVAAASSHFPSLPFLPPSLLSVYSLFAGQYLKYSKYEHRSPRQNARPIVRKGN